jgi:hypothetical protein
MQTKQKTKDFLFEIIDYRKESVESWDVYKNDEFIQNFMDETSVKFNGRSFKIEISGFHKELLDHYHYQMVSDTNINVFHMLERDIKTTLHQVLFQSIEDFYNHGYRTNSPTIGLEFEKYSDTILPIIKKAKNDYCSQHHITLKPTGKDEHFYLSYEARLSPELSAVMMIVLGIFEKRIVRDFNKNNTFAKELYNNMEFIDSCEFYDRPLSADDMDYDPVEHTMNLI